MKDPETWIVIRPYLGYYNRIFAIANRNPLLFEGLRLGGEPYRKGMRPMTPRWVCLCRGHDRQTDPLAYVTRFVRIGDARTAALYHGGDVSVPFGGPTLV